ncbi:TRAP transporter small permease [Paenibacillaceae bacterium WGS1546]|uniref:TRAP transporter small permease n=1 Tax=Cohnella sp. WGS1546 TaxID=3366810 RepID=UPI00372D7188
MKWIDRMEEALIALFLILAACLTTLNVVLRVMGEGITWSEELVRYLIIWMTFLGVSVCIREGAHVGIDLLPQIARGKLKTAIETLIYGLAIGCSALFAYYGYQFFDFALGKNQLAPSLGIQMHIVYFVLPLTGALMVLRYVQRIVALYRNATHH